jgi:hypothetical protein
VSRCRAPPMLPARFIPVVGPDCRGGRGTAHRRARGAGDRVLREPNHHPSALRQELFDVASTMTSGGNQNPAKAEHGTTRTARARHRHLPPLSPLGKDIPNATEPLKLTEGTSGGQREIEEVPLIRRSGRAHFWRCVTCVPREWAKIAIAAFRNSFPLACGGIARTPPERRPESTSTIERRSLLPIVSPDRRCQ